MRGGHTSENVPCNNCKKMISSLYHFKQHIEKHHNAVQYNSQEEKGGLEERNVFISLYITTKEYSDSVHK